MRTFQFIQKTTPARANTTSAIQPQAAQKPSTPPLKSPIDGLKYPVIRNLIILTCQEKNTDVDINVITKTYMQKINSIPDATEQLVELPLFYHLLDCLAQHSKTEAIKCVLETIPARFCNNGQLSAFDYFYNAFSNQNAVTHTADRRHLALSLQSKKTIATHFSRALATAKNDNELLTIFGPCDEKAFKSYLSSELTTRLLSEGTVGKHFPKEVIKNLITLSPTPTAQHLVTALNTCSDLTFANQLIKADAPTITLIDKIDASLFKQKSGRSTEEMSETTSLLLEKQVKVLKAYYIDKIEPFFKDISHPIFSGRPELDLMTIVFRKIFTSEREDEEERAQKLLFEAARHKTKIKTAYENMLATLTHPNTTLEKKLKVVKNLFHVFCTELLDRHLILALHSPLLRKRYEYLIFNDDNHRSGFAIDWIMRYKIDHDLSPDFLKSLEQFEVTEPKLQAQKKITKKPKLNLDLRKIGKGNHPNFFIQTADTSCSISPMSDLDLYYVKSPGEISPVDLKQSMLKP